MLKPYQKLINSIQYEPINSENLQGILITSSHNLRYYTGFAGGCGIALIGKDNRYLFVDSRYTEEAKKEAPDFEVIQYEAGHLYAEIQSKISNLDITCLGFEDSVISLAQYKAFSEKLTSRLVGIGNKADINRMVKTDKELSLMRIAESIGDKALTEVLPMISQGVRECDIAAELEYKMRKLGAEKTSFDTIVVSGEKSAMPHGMPNEKVLEKGDFVTIDFGCVYKGYCSDMTRTFVIGEPSDKQLDIYNTVLAAQLEGLKNISAGVSAAACDNAAREIIKKAEYGKYFGHALGHGVGLQIHEFPTLSPKSDIILEKNMVVTCEPGIYIGGFGGVRIEDMVAVTKNGCEILSSFPKELIVCR